MRVLGTLGHSPNGRGIPRRRNVQELTSLPQLSEINSECPTRIEKRTPPQQIMSDRRIVGGVDQVAERSPSMYTGRY